MAWTKDEKSAFFENWAAPLGMIAYFGMVGLLLSLRPANNPAISQPTAASVVAHPNRSATTTLGGPQHKCVVNGSQAHVISCPQSPKP